MDDQVGIVAEYPFALFVAFHASPTLADLLELKRDFVRYRLHLLSVSAVADQKIIGKSSYRGQVQDFYFSGFFRLCVAYRNEPVGLGILVRIGFGSYSGEVGFRFGQNFS